MGNQGWLNHLRGIRDVFLNGVPLPLRERLNFTGQATVTDDAANGWTNIAIMPADVILTPSALAADQNDYGPDGFDAATVLRIGLSGGSRTITGFLAQAQNVKKRIVNTSNALTLTLAHDSDLSEPENRILCPGGLDFVLSPGASVEVWDDLATSMWRVLDVSGGSGSAAAAIIAQVSNWTCQYVAGLSESGVAGLPHVSAGKRANYSPSSQPPVFVAVGGEPGNLTAVFTSLNGTLWIERDLTTDSLPVEDKMLYAAAYSAELGLWALVGQAMGTDALIMTGQDPVVGEFTERSNPEDLDLYSVLAVGDGFIACGANDETGPYVLTSADGTTWSAVVVASPVAAPLLDIAWDGDEVYVMVGGNTEECVIVRGVVGGATQTLTLVDGPTSKCVRCVWNGRVFATMTDDGGMWTSPDGLTWTAASALPEGLLHVGTMAADPATGTIIAVGVGTPMFTASNGPVCVTLDDCASWTAVADFGDGTDRMLIRHMTHGHGRFVATGGHWPNDVNATILAASARR